MQPSRGWMKGLPSLFVQAPRRLAAPKERLLSVPRAHLMPLSPLRIPSAQAASEEGSVACFEVEGQWSPWILRQWNLSTSKSFTACLLPRGCVQCV